MSTARRVISYGCDVCSRNCPCQTTSSSNKQALLASGGWENKPLLGKQADDHLMGAKKKGMITATIGAEEWVPLIPKASYVFRFGAKSPIFAVAARRRDAHGKRHDRRDLRIIGDAVSAAFVAVEKAGYTSVFLGAIAAGKKSGLHPVHTFAQTLRGIFAFSKVSNGCLKDIHLHLVDARVWALIAGGKLPIAQLLSSEVLPFEVEVHDSKGGIENLRVMFRGTPRIDEVLRHTRLSRKHWTVLISPPPTDENRSDYVQASANEDITSTMRVILSQNRRRSSARIALCRYVLEGNSVPGLLWEHRGSEPRQYMSPKLLTKKVERALGRVWKDITEEAFALLSEAESRLADRWSRVLRPLALILLGIFFIA
jgi:hypothetical protein